MSSDSNDDLGAAVRKLFSLFKEDLIDRTALDETDHRKNLIEKIKKLPPTSPAWVSKNLAVFTNPFGGILVQFASSDRLRPKPGSPEALTMNDFAAIREVLTEIGNFNSIATVWLHFPMPCPTFALSLLEGNINPGECNAFHDTQEDLYKMWKWTSPSDCKVPPPATHNVGACGFLYNRKEDKVLLVKIKRRRNWSFPGGNFDQLRDETICNTAYRETWEETGFLPTDPTKKKELIDSASLVGIMSFPLNQFAPAMNYIWMFQADSFGERNMDTPDACETERLEWVPRQEIIDAGNENREIMGFQVGPEIVAAARAGKDKGLRPNEGNKWMTLYSFS